MIKKEILEIKLLPERIVDPRICSCYAEKSLYGDYGENLFNMEYTMVRAKIRCLLRSAAVWAALPIKIHHKRKTFL